VSLREDATVFVRDCRAVPYEEVAAGLDATVRKARAAAVAERAPDEPSGTDLARDH
jgi:hypothetical protein